MVKKSFRYSLIASLVLHAVLTFSVVLYQPTKPKVYETVELDLVSAPPETVKKSAPDEARQIVEQNEKAVNDEIDEKAKYLSRNNQKVIKQTVALNRGAFRNSGSRNNSAGTGSKEVTLKDFAPKMDYAKAIERKMQAEADFDKQATEKALKKLQEKKQANRKDQTLGTGGSMASQTIDYIKDIDPGLETMLSSKEFVYFTFYQRIRNQLQQHWNDMVREKLTAMYKKGRTIASTDDRITKLLITLDKKGTLVKIQVIGDSGVSDLDEAAVDAFRASAPFPNPPAGMVDDDGQIKIRWDFVLEA